MTPPQGKLLGLLQAYVSRYGYPPTHRELAKLLHVQPNAIAERLGRLEAQGRITRPSPRCARGITLTAEVSRETSDPRFLITEHGVLLERVEV